MSINYSAAVLSLAAFCLLATSQNVHGSDGNDRLFAQTDRLRPHAPNYLIGQSTDDDDWALEASYSFRFMLTGENDESSDRWAIKSTEDCGLIRECTHTYFKYNGEFDFYFGSRESGPIISRLNNPALHARHYFNLGSHQSRVSKVR